MQGRQSQKLHKVAPFSFPSNSKKLSSWSHVRRIKALPEIQVGGNNYERLISEEVLNRGCKSSGENLGKEKKVFHQWVFNEEFVANCDWSYLGRGKMGEIIQEVYQNCKDKKDNIITLRMFKNVQRSLNRPKIFNEQFIEQERIKLDRNRIQLRNQNQQAKKCSINSQIKNQSQVAKLQVGNQVWVYRFNCEHLHAGKILSMNKDSFLIKYNNTEFSSEKIPQYCVSSLLMNGCNVGFQDSIPHKIQGNLGKKNQVDISAFEVYLYMLKLKEELLTILKDFHNLSAEKQQNNLILSRKQIQQYGWVGSIIVIINITLKWIENNYQMTISSSQLFHREKCTKLKMPMLVLSECYGRSWVGSSEEQEEKRQNMGSLGKEEVVDLINQQKVGQKNKKISQIETKTRSKDIEQPIHIPQKTIKLKSRSSKNPPKFHNHKQKDECSEPLLDEIVELKKPRQN